MLGDGGAALNDASGAQVGPGRARDAQIVDATVLEKSDIFGGDEGASNHLRNVFDRDKGALFHKELADGLAVGRQDMAGPQGAVVRHCVQVGGQVGLELLVSPDNEADGQCRDAEGDRENQPTKCGDKATDKPLSCRETCFLACITHHLSMGRVWRIVNFVRVIACALSCLLASVAVAEPSKAVAGTELPKAAVCENAQGFVVERFQNVEHVGLLEPMTVALPATVAERLAFATPLRFVGPAMLISDETPTPLARYRVQGRFTRSPGMAVKLSIDIVLLDSQGAPVRVVGHSERSVARSGLASAAVQIAVEAFASVPGLSTPTMGLAATRPFSRDPYAFLWYGRGLLSALQNTRGGSDRALSEFNRSLVVDPQVPETRRLYGLLHLLQGRPGHARTHFSLAIDVRPDYTLAYRSLAALDRSTGDPAAIERYLNVLRLDPIDIDARRTLGELYYEKGELDLAQQTLEAVVAFNGDDLKARRVLALVLSARQAGGALVSQLEEVVRLDANNVDAQMDLGAAYLATGMTDKAIAIYESVLKLEPRHLDALKLSGDLARNGGRDTDAIARYTRLHRLAPQDPRPLFLLGALFSRSGNHVAAQRMFEEAALYPGLRAEAYANLGAVALQMGDGRQARWYLQRAIRWDAGNVTARFNHALVLRAFDQPALALGEVRIAEKLAPNDAGLRFLAGVLNLRLGLTDAASRDFLGVLELEPNHIDARQNLTLLGVVLAPHRELTMAGPGGSPLTGP